ncbi:MAG: hypothetical protein K6U12_07240 [Armatimonadetes bacterium]|nr:hypothetical protein [Armatimonadota bacterium]CUU35161.1 Copper amine oxidase N-terminal domain-containing protein [Armatimonadetes bacterium DC]
MRARQWISVLALAGLSMVAPSQDAAPVKVFRGSANQVVLQFERVRPAYVEILVNGQVIATRTVQGAQITLGLTSMGLAPGTHEAVIRLYDRQGRLIGETRAPVELQPDPYAPVNLIIPRNGTRVSGTIPVEARLNLQGNMYVTFFVDGQARALRNFAPYIYQWDTTQATNGWHTLEVWVFDGKQTFKTPPTRVFVNNPGGRTERQMEPELSGEMVEPAVVAVESSPSAELSGLRTGEMAGSAAPLELRLSTPANEAIPSVPAEPALSVALAPAETNPAAWRTAPGTGQPQFEARFTAPEVPPSTRFTPTPVYQWQPGWRVAKAEPQMRGQKLTVPPVLASAPKSAAPTAYESAVLLFRHGTRLPSTIRTFELVWNGRVIVPDVAPRVEEGIPLVTVRHALESAGATIRWDNQHKQATILLGEKTLVLDVRANRATLNEIPLTLDAPLQIVNGRVIVPAALLGEVLNADILFDLTTHQLILTPRT